MIYSQNKLNGCAKEAYNYIAQEIFNGNLNANTPLSEIELTSNLKSSRTPVREALVALEQDGLITRIRNRGWFVVEISTRDIEEIFELRILMETHALKTAYKIVPSEEWKDLKERIESLNEKSSPEEYFVTDRDLHNRIIRYCGNKRLVDFIRQLNMQIEHLRVISSQKPERLKISRLEHLEIIEAIEKQDLKEALTLLTGHIEHVRDSVLEVKRFM